MTEPTTDYTAQAQALIAAATVEGPREHCGPPGSEAHCTWGDTPIWTIDLIEVLNMTIDVGAATEDDARVDQAVIDIVASRLIENARKTDTKPATA